MHIPYLYYLIKYYLQPTGVCKVKLLSYNFYDSKSRNSNVKNDLPFIYSY